MNTMEAQSAFYPKTVGTREHLKHAVCCLFAPCHFPTTLSIIIPFLLFRVFVFVLWYSEAPCVARVIWDGAKLGKMNFILDLLVH